MRRGGLLLLVLLLAPSARATEPTVWERAQRPGARAEARARLRAEQLYEQASDPSGDSEQLRDLSLGSAALLELSGGARRDPWQAVLLGRVLLDARPGREREALQLIVQGVSALPDSDYKRQSLFDLGVGSMLVGDYERSERAMTAALALAWDPDYRSSIYRNRSNLRMLSGQLRGAVADARSAVQLARGVEVVALSHFKLGVALERSGDYPQGLQEVARGVAVRLPVPPYPTESVLELPSLRWVPDYDVHYYRALAAMAEATSAGVEEEVVVERYESALVDWEQYRLAASEHDARYLPNARRHELRCAEALARLRGAEGRGAPGAGSGRRR